MTQSISRPTWPSHKIRRLGEALQTPGISDQLTTLFPKSQTVPAGKQIVREGEENAPVVLLLSGWLSLVKSLPQGERQLIDLLVPVDIAQPVAADGLTAAAGVEAVTDATIIRIPNHSWAKMCRDNNDLETLDRSLDRAARARMYERILRMGQGSAAMRVAYILLELWTRLRVRGDDLDLTFHVPLTQQMIGDFAGLTSVHVCRVLGRFVKSGIIESSDHIDIRVLDVRALAKIAEIDLKILENQIKTADSQPIDMPPLHRV